MKSEIIQEQPEDSAIEYPCLMQGKYGLVVLFVKEDCGVVVMQSDVYSLGYYAKDWATDTFTPFKGQIVLSND